jgi:hypothetical protein
MDTVLYGIGHQRRRSGEFSGAKFKIAEDEWKDGGYKQSLAIDAIFSATFSHE